MKKLFTVVLGVCSTTLILSGCSLQSKVGNAAGQLVSAYCVKPASERALVRLWIDEATKPNHIRVQCAIDQPQAAQG